jgi:predicted PurR-regulated permease PerM
MGPAEGPGSQAAGPRPAGAHTPPVAGATSGVPEPIPATPTGPHPLESVPLADPEPPRSSLRAIAWFKRFAKLWGFLLFCIFVVYAFRQVVLPFIFAILVAYILAPLVDRLARLRVAGRPLPRGLAVIIIYINLIAVLGLFLGYFIPKLSGDFARLFREAPALFQRLNQDVLPRAGAWVDQNLGAGAVPAEAPEPTEATAPPGVLVEPLGGGKLRVDLTGLVLEVEQGPGGKLTIAAPKADVPYGGTEGKWERSIKQWIAERVKTTEIESRRALEYGQRFVAGVLTGLARLVLVLMVAAFILIDLQRLRGFIRSLVPQAYQRDYDRIVGGIDRGLSGVIRGQLLICLINGSLTYVGLRLFEVKYPLLLAGIAAVMSLVPIFGSILSSFPIVAIALVSSGTFDVRQGLYILIWIIVIHLLEANFLNPKIMGGTAKIHPVLVVFALIAGEQSYGLVGALFAVPGASIIQTIFIYFRRKQFRAPALPRAPESSEL